MKVLALVTEAFGGRGGIALYNRDLLSAVCSHPDSVAVVAVPRLLRETPSNLPSRLDYVTGGVRNKPAYLWAVLQAARRQDRFDLIICSHLNLLPIAWLLGAWMKAPVLLVIYGVDAWKPSPSALTNTIVRRVHAVVSISDLTRNRFFAWTGVNGKPFFVLPNAIHTERYASRAKNPALLERYGLGGKTVLMTLGRMWASERTLKGFDRVLEVLPHLTRELPTVAYLAAGDGDDRSRLLRKARSLGIAESVVFPGWVREDEKAEFYNLADVFVMPSEGEGFGFVFLEAMACGVPVVAAKRMAAARRSGTVSWVSWSILIIRTS